MPGLDELLSLPVADLRARFLEREESVPEGLLERLLADERKAAQALARAIERRRAANRAEGQRLRHLLTLERELWESGHAHVAGTDEAGAGPLAGPVVAAACILPHDFALKGVDDSKKLTPEERDVLEAGIKERAVAWCVASAEVEEIDKLNIFRASLLAMQRAVTGLAVRPDFLLVDARRVPGVDIPQRGVVHGDALSLSIAAASILAKTERDRRMVALSAVHPGYAFEVHKGYGTPEHLEALKRLGACPIHRRSFAPVREALGLGAVQQSLPLRPRPA